MNTKNSVVITAVVRTVAVEMVEAPKRLLSEFKKKI